jgi:transcriptional regulator with XRE-family HTH domain
MRFVVVGRQLRMMRIRREWRQSDVAARARVSASVIARQERGVVNSLSMLDRHAAALDARVDLRLAGRAGQLIRLADEEHAAIVDLLAQWLRELGFDVESEASYSEWGERGRIDLLAYRRKDRTVVIVEVKTLLLDLQDVLGSLNIRERLGSAIARRRGWDVGRLVTALAVAYTASNRKVVRAHAALFAPFTVRRLTGAALASDRRVLLWIAPARTSRSAWIAGRQRVRPRSGQRSSVICR